MNDIEKYIMTSPKFEGELVFEFQSDLLVRLDFSNAKLSKEQHLQTLEKFPKELSVLQVYLKKYKDVQFEPAMISFEMFWNKYDDKLNSSKKRALHKWNKMSLHEQSKAYKFIARYLNNIPYGTRQKYAETYLSAELWNN